MHNLMDKLPMLQNGLKQSNWNKYKLNFNIIH